ncbi:MAG: ABC transporter permease subunit [Chloroflexota bacterium]|nr:MAG: ABC transporter permease subunit [Chloroflexota bacterium]
MLWRLSGRAVPRGHPEHWAWPDGSGAQPRHELPAGERYIILPQAFRVVLPPLGNEFIAMLKDTALLTVIALPELTQRARIFAADTFRVFEPYITIGALYLCMTLLLSVLVRAAERRLALPR